ncbi:MAG: nucleotidyltransferase family protein [Planctomycetes bacterium]|nr:nucleotidyltransferase family protein [Planctomycetota bacterium]
MSHYSQTTDSIIRATAQALLHGYGATIPPCPDAEVDLVKSELTANGIAPLCSNFLDQANNARLRDALAPFVKRANALAVLSESFLAELSTRLQALGLTCAATRSSGLTRSLYPSPACRPSTDIDIVVRREDFHRVADAATACGFSRNNERKDWSFVKSGIVLDIAANPSKLFCITDMESEKRNFAALDDDWTSHLTPGEQRNISWLSPAMEFFTSAMHYAYKHRFERAIWGVDLALISRRLSESDIRELESILKKTGTNAVILHALNSARISTGADFPPELTDLLPPSDRNPIRNALFKKCMKNKTSFDTGIAIAFTCADNFALRYDLLKNALFSRRIKNSKGSYDEVSLLQRIKHMATLPLRLARAIF